jgi:hypothetical protein
LPLHLPRVADPVTDRALQLLAQQTNPPVPQARVYNDANISIANTTVTALTFNTQRWNEGSLHSTSTNSGRLTARVAGLYLIGGSVQYAANATGVRFTAIRLNGSTYITDDIRASAGAGDPTDASVCTAYQMDVDDYVELTTYQASGGALNVVSSGNRSPEFWIARIAGFTAQALT